jgi:hypothetical protein
MSNELEDALLAIYREIAALNRRLSRVEVHEGHNFSAANIGTATGAGPGQVHTKGDGVIIKSEAATATSYLYGLLLNGTGQLYFGVEGSVAGTVWPGTAAYDAFLIQGGAKALHLGTNGAINVTIASDGSVTLTGDLIISSLAGGGKRAISVDNNGKIVIT